MATKPDVKKQRCCERRHMPAHVFMTYDAIRACCGNGRQFWGNPHTLANLNNRNVQSEREGMARLEHDGWLVKKNAEGRRMNDRRELLTDLYDVLDHDEWVAAVRRECPVAKYVADEKGNWKLAKPGKAAPGLRRKNVLRAIKMDSFPDFWIDVVADALEAKSPNTGVPEQVDAQPRHADLNRAYTGAPEQANTGIPEQDQYRATCTKPNSEPNHLALPNLAVPERAGQGSVRRGVVTFAATKEAKLAAEKLWQELRNAENLPTEMAMAKPSQAAMAAVLAHLALYEMDDYVDAISEWADARQPGLGGLYTRWEHWLKEGGPLLAQLTPKKKDR